LGAGIPEEHISSILRDNPVEILKSKNLM